METNDPIVVLENVTKRYLAGQRGDVTAVRGVSLSVHRGDYVTITGRSGSGKTTLLNLVSGLTRPTSGRVLLNGDEAWNLPDAQQSAIRNRRLGFVFQFPSLIPSLTALENVLLPTVATRGTDGAAMRRKAAALLEGVGLSDKRDAYPRELSAGQQQRVVVARALINDPELLLADEPTSNLDERTEREIMALLRRVHRERNITVLLVTHSTDLAVFGTRFVHMAAGEIVSEGAPSDGERGVELLSSFSVLSGAGE